MQLLMVLQAFKSANVGGNRKPRQARNLTQCGEGGGGSGAKWRLTAERARCSALRFFPEGAWMRPGVSIRIMLGQKRYSMRMLISRESNDRTGSFSSRRFSDSM